MVDAVDSKSTGGNFVGVQISPPAPLKLKFINKLFLFRSEILCQTKNPLRNG